MKTKDDLRQEIDQTRREALTFLQDVDSEQIIYEESGWRVKDIVAHVVTWETEMLRSLHAYRRGGAYRIANYEQDDYNAFAASMKQFDPLDQTLADWEAVRNWFTIHLNAMSPEALDDTMIMPWGAEGTVRDLFESLRKHLEEHLADIQAKVAAQTSESSPQH